MGTFSGPVFTDDPHPRQLSKRGWTLLGVTGVVVVVIYWLVVSFYSSEGGSSFESASGTKTAGIDINFEPIGISPDTGNANFRLIMSSNDESISDQDGRAVNNIRVTVSGPDGSQEIRIPQGNAFGRDEVVLGIEGELAQYPLDSYTGLYFVNADVYDRLTGGVNESKESIPIEITSIGAINGWNSSLSVATTGSSGLVLSAEFDRAFSTKLFAFVLLALAAIVSLLALLISILVLSTVEKLRQRSWPGPAACCLPSQSCVPTCLVRHQLVRQLIFIFSYGQS